MSEQRADTADK